MYLSGSPVGGATGFDALGSYLRIVTPPLPGMGGGARGGALGGAG